MNWNDMTERERMVWAVSFALSARESRAAEGFIQRARRADVARIKAMDAVELVRECGFQDEAKTEPGMVALCPEDAA